MLELLERIEENPRQFKYLWAVFDSSKDSAVHDEVEARDKLGEKVMKTSQTADHDSSNAIPTKGSSQGQESRKLISEAPHQPGIKENTRNWHESSRPSYFYCCKCRYGPFTAMFNPRCPNCGHERCHACQRKV